MHWATAQSTAAFAAGVGVGVGVGEAVGVWLGVVVGVVAGLAAAVAVAVSDGVAPVAGSPAGAAQAPAASRTATQGRRRRCSRFTSAAYRWSGVSFGPRIWNDHDMGRTWKWLVVMLAVVLALAGCTTTEQGRAAFDRWLDGQRWGTRVGEVTETSETLFGTLQFLSASIKVDKPLTNRQVERIGADLAKQPRSPLWLVTVDDGQTSVVLTNDRDVNEAVRAHLDHYRRTPDVTGVVLEVTTLREHLVTLRAEPSRLAAVLDATLPRREGIKRITLAADGLTVAYSDDPGDLRDRLAHGLWLSEYGQVEIRAHESTWFQLDPADLTAATTAWPRLQQLPSGWNVALGHGAVTVGDLTLDAAAVETLWRLDGVPGIKKLSVFDDHVLGGQFADPTVLARVVDATAGMPVTWNFEVGPCWLDRVPASQPDVVGDLAWCGNLQILKTRIASDAVVLTQPTGNSADAFVRAVRARAWAGERRIILNEGDARVSFTATATGRAHDVTMAAFAGGPSIQPESQRRLDALMAAWEATAG